MSLPERNMLTAAVIVFLADGLGDPKPYSLRLVLKLSH